MENTTEPQQEPVTPTAPDEPQTQTPAEQPDTAPQPAAVEPLTASKLMEMLAAAEEKGYNRARTEMAAQAPVPTTPLWGNPRRIETEEDATVEVGDEFLRCVRPAVWD